MKRQQITPNVAITTIPSEKFKRNRITINFIIPNLRQTATIYAILPSIMERAYADYPDMKLFSQKLSQMYGASFSASCGVAGQNRTIRFTIQGIKDEFCLSGEKLLMEMCQVILGIIFKPCIENDGFIAEWLEVEKVKLREEIEGEINDKRGYCVKNAQRKFFMDSLNSVERLGYLEEIDNITPQDMYKAYKKLLNSSVVEIFITADEVADITPVLEDSFKNRQDESVRILPIDIMQAVSNPKEYEEKLDITQCKVCLLYTTTRQLTDEERFYMLVGGAVFGGTSNSRLFKNVREKQSLCYYCTSSFNGFTSSLRVDSGVENKNTKVVADAIDKELQNLINGDINSDELEESKLTIINSLNALYDGLSGLEAWYLNEAIRHSNYTPKQVIEKVKSINSQQIKDVLKLLNLNVIYKLTN